MPRSVRILLVIRALSISLAGSAEAACGKQTIPKGLFGAERELALLLKQSLSPLW